MLTPVLPQTIEFTSDGTSTAMTVDLTLAPLNLQLRGAGPLAILLPAVNSILGAGPGVTAVVVGTVVTFTFASTLPQLSGGNTVLYSLTFFVQL